MAFPEISTHDWPEQVSESELQTLAIRFALHTCIVNGWADTAYVYARLLARQTIDANGLLFIREAHRTLENRSLWVPAGFTPYQPTWNLRIRTAR